EDRRNLAVLRIAQPLRIDELLLVDLELKVTQHLLQRLHAGLQKIISEAQRRRLSAVRSCSAVRTCRNRFLRHRPQPTSASARARRHDPSAMIAAPPLATAIREREGEIFSPPPAAR